MISCHLEGCASQQHSAVCAAFCTARLLVLVRDQGNLEQAYAMRGKHHFPAHNCALSQPNNCKAQCTQQAIPASRGPAHLCKFLPALIGFTLMQQQLPRSCCRCLAAAWGVCCLCLLLPHCCMSLPSPSWPAMPEPAQLLHLRQQSLLLLLQLAPCPGPHPALPAAVLPSLPAEQHILCWREDRARARACTCRNVPTS
jgi:hypothetical protein